MKLGLAPLTAMGLLALAGTNGWLITGLLGDPEPAVDERMATATPVSGSNEPANGQLPAKPPSAYRETLAHPVFHKTRAPFVMPPRPAPPAAVKLTTPPPPADPGIGIGGVAIDGDLRKAYLFTKGNSQGAWVG